MNLNKLSPILLTLLVFLLAQGIGAILAIVFGIEPASRLALILMAVNILAVLACRFLLHNIRFRRAFSFSTVSWRTGWLALVGGLLGATSLSFLGDLVELPQSLMENMLAISHDFYGLVTIVLVGPVAEELLFREAIEGEMLRRGANPWTAILVSALAFGVVHLNLAQGLYALPLGILFGIIYYKTGNVVLTSLLHIINNGIVAVQLCIMGEEAVNTSYADWFGSDLAAYAFMAFSALLCFVLMRLFWQHYRPCKKVA